MLHSQKCVEEEQWQMRDFLIFKPTLPEKVRKKTNSSGVTYTVSCIFSVERGGPLHVHVT